MNVTGIQDRFGIGDGVPQDLRPDVFPCTAADMQRAAARAHWPSMRSAESLRLEGLVRHLRGVEQLVRLGVLHRRAPDTLLDWVAVVRPDTRLRCLTVTHAGPGLSAMQGSPLTGTDYLDLVDPAIKGEAFDSVLVMLARRCGLWQLSPARMVCGSSEMFELTGVPVLDEATGCPAVLFLSWHPTPDFRRVLAVGHAQVWSWLDLRQGFPA